jgi:hypothetical protein
MGTLAEVAAAALRDILPQLGKAFHTEIARLAERIGPKLTATLLKLTALIYLFYEFLDHSFIERFGTLIEMVFLPFVAPDLQPVAIEMSRQLLSALLIDYRVILLILIASIGFLVSFICVPLLNKLLFKRRLKVFISFNNVRESLAETLQKCFENDRTKVLRIPFKRMATHQDVVMHAVEGIKNCDSFVCLPGLAESYVEHEVLAATTSTKPVVFLVSESAGRLPNTADKRYPVFRLEATVHEKFNPLIQFVHYIGADLKSTCELCKRALGHPFMRISSAVALSLGMICLLFLLGYCYYRVKLVGDELAKKSALFSMVHEPVVLGHLFVFIVAASLGFLSVSYSALFTSNLVWQLQARKKARLKTIAGQFNRDDWIGILSVLIPGTKVYECLFETAPFAHHEIERAQITRIARAD